MLKKYFPIPEKNTTGVLIAVGLFIVQIIYYDLQGVFINNWIASLFGLETIYESLSIFGFHLNHAASLLGATHIFFHAGISVLIIWQLYKDPFNTRFVIYLSCSLIVAYFLLYLGGRYSDSVVFHVMANKVRFFLSSPMKTIFSIPALKVREEDTATKDQQDSVKAY